MLHADDGAFIVQEYDPFGCGSGALDGFAGFFRNQTARMVVIILLVVSGYLPSLCRACQIRVGLCYPLAETVVGVGMALGAAGQPGQLTLAPCGGHAVITGGTAHGVVGNAAAAEAGQLVRTVAKGSGSIAAAGGGVQGIVVGLNAGQVANIIIRINKGFCKSLIIFPHQLAVLIVGVALILLGHTLGGIVVRLDAAQVIIGIAVGADVDAADLVCHRGYPGCAIRKVLDKRAGADGGGFLGQPLVCIEGVGGFCLLGTADHRQEKASQAVIGLGGVTKLS